MAGGGGPCICSWHTHARTRTRGVLRSLGGRRARRQTIIIARRLHAEPPAARLQGAKRTFELLPAARVGGGGGKRARVCIL